MTNSMDGSQLLSMLRRRRRALIVGLLLGILAALALESGQERYRAQAQLLIGGPDSNNTDANSLERNLNSQLSVLRSTGTARAVAEALGGSTGTEEVLAATTITELPGSDVVQIETLAERPAVAQAIADGYVEVYLAASAERSQAQIGPEIQRLDERLADIDRQVTATNEELADAVAPFLNSTTGIPDPRTVAPEAAARQQLLLNEYDRVLGQRQELQQQLQLQSRSTVLQPAVADEEPIGPDRRRQLLIVLAVGLSCLGAALALDGLTGRTISDDEVEEALDTRIAATIPAPRRFRGDSLAIDDPHRRVGEDERLLWLKTERLCPADGTALVLVTGAAPRSGVTTLAASLASQFAGSGHRTVLIDAVGGPRSVTQIMLGDRPGGSLDSDTVPHPYLPRLEIVGHGEDGQFASGAALRATVAAVSPEADVLIVDTEAGLGSALLLARQAHVVVVAVDAKRSKVKQLEALGLVLADVRDRLLPVLTHPGRRKRVSLSSPRRRRGDRIAPVGATVASGAGQDAPPQALGVLTPELGDPDREWPA